MRKGKAFKIIVLALVLVLVSGVLTACSTTTGSSSASTDLLTKITKDKMVVTLNLENAPWSYKDPSTGKITGLAVELIQNFADKSGIKVEYMPLEFSSLIPAIDSGKADIICTNLSRTIPRGMKVMYTEPIGGSPGVAVVLKGKFTTFDQINQPGVILTTEVGSVHEKAGAEVFPKAKMQAVNQNADAMAALKSGRADVFLTGMDVAEAMKQKDPDIDYLKEFVFNDSFAFAVKLAPTSYTFVEAFNNYMRVIKVSGDYSKLYTKYFNAPWNPITVGEAF